MCAEAAAVCTPHGSPQPLAKQRLNLPARRVCDGCRAVASCLAADMHWSRREGAAVGCRKPRLPGACSSGPLVRRQHCRRPASRAPHPSLPPPAPLSPPPAAAAPQRRWIATPTSRCSRRQPPPGPAVPAAAAAVPAAAVPAAAWSASCWSPRLRGARPAPACPCNGALGRAGLQQTRGAGRGAKSEPGRMPATSQPTPAVAPSPRCCPAGPRRRRWTISKRWRGSTASGPL